MSDETGNHESMMILSNSYQADFVEMVANALSPARFLLSAPPGSGKTIALVASACALHSKRSDMRCLMIAPKALAGLWVDQLTANAGISAVEMNPQTYRRLQAESGSNINLWANIPCAMASPGFLSIAGRIEEVLEAGWDLVILDEVHQFSQFTKRGEIAKRIWNSPSVKIAVAASSTPEPFEWIAADASTKRVRWSLPEVIGYYGAPGRDVRTVYYETSIPERQITVLIDELVRGMPKDQASQFATGQITRRLGSSMYALEQTLRRLLTVENFGDTDLNDWAPEDLSPEADTGAEANSVRIDRQATEQILALLEEVPSDSKWECCLHLLETHEIGRTKSGIIFTDYADTAEYLEFMARGHGLQTHLLTGALSASERKQAVGEAESVSSLVIATGAIEGTNLAFTDQVIHYDLPWNPRGLLQRMGRVERISSQFKEIIHYFIHEQVGETNPITPILDQLRAIEDEWR